MWAMIPLTVFGAMPRIGCICANGQHKFFCERHLMKAGGPQCACCYGRHVAVKCRAAEGSRALRSGRQAKELLRGQSKRAAQVLTRAAFDTDCPCRPVVDRTVSISAAKAVLDLDCADHMPLFLAALPILAVVPAVSFDHARGDLPPPPDLVTTLGVLLI